MVCAICIAPLFALTGAGSMAAATLNDEQIKTRKIFFWLGIVSTIISIVLMFIWAEKSNSPEGCVECEENP